MNEIILNQEDVKKYEEDKNNFIVPEPWDDPLSDKNGLINIYIESTLAECINISAQSDDGLLKENQEYKIFHQKITKFMDEKNVENFDNLMDFCKKYLDKDISLSKWKGYIPDIRQLHNIDLVLSWIHSKYL
jgi:hypothetical protein